jgi:long-chain fatty acid transport protein
MKLKAIGPLGLAVLASGVYGSGAQAAGFALYESSASALGTAFAGQAVVAQDASTIFANPAGLTQVAGSQLVAGATGINSSSQYTSTAGVKSGGDPGATTFLPSLFYAMDLNRDVKLGFGLYTPFGLKTDYDNPWAGSSQGLLSDLKTVNFNPTLAWKMNDKLSLGLGVDYQYIEAKLSNNVGGPLVGTMKGDDTAWGYNLGVTYQVDDATRLALSYRSKLDYRLSGTLGLNNPLVPGYPKAIYADLTVPDMASLAVAHRLDDRWTVMADATWTGWSVFDKLNVQLAANGATASSTIENWKDAWRFGLGASYKSSDAWTWRFGVAYDQTPVPDAAHRTARIPDSDRISVAAGGRYTMSPKNLLDVGYMHIFFKDAPTTDAPLTGSYDSHADVLGLQLTHNF